MKVNYGNVFAGFASWLLLVVSVVIAGCAAGCYASIIEEEKIPPKNLVNPYEKRSKTSESAFYFRENPSAK